MAEKLKDIYGEFIKCSKELENLLESIRSEIIRILEDLGHATNGIDFDIYVDEFKMYHPFGIIDYDDIVELERVFKKEGFELYKIGSYNTTDGGFIFYFRVNTDNSGVSTDME